MDATDKKDGGKAGYIQEVHKCIGSSSYCLYRLDLLRGKSSPLSLMLSLGCFINRLQHIM